MVKMRIFLYLSILFIPVPLAYGDIFDRLNQNNDLMLHEAIDNDTRGYYYDSVTDYSFKPDPKEPEVSTRASLSLGCSGFDYNANFLNQFRLQALSDRLTSLGKEVMAASPLLLLEYASPTLADLLKHFNNNTNFKLGLLYSQCEDIENAVSDRLTKLRKKSEADCIAQAPPDDLQAVERCKNQKDPFAFLKDIDGTPLKNGGEINILKDALKRISVSEEEKGMIKERLPETQITSGGIKTISPELEIEHVIAKKRDESLALLITIYDKYVKDPESVSDTELESLSIPGVPITRSTLDDWKMLDKYDRILKFAQIASSKARYDAIKEYQNHLLTLNLMILDTNTEDYEKDELNKDIEYIKSAITRTDDNQTMRDKHAQILKDSVEEAERRRLRALGELNTSDLYSKDANESSSENMLLIAK